MLTRTLSCWTSHRCPDPAMGTRLLYWATLCLLGTLGQGLEILTLFQNKDAVDTSGMPDARFSAKRPQGLSSTLEIQRVEPGDSAVYLCASSLVTVGHSHLLPVHKPHPSLSLHLLERETPSPTEAEITQTPRYRIVSTGHKTVLECSQHMNHFGMFWYRQDPGQGPRLIHYSNDIGSTAEGEVTEGYRVSRPEKAHFPLTLESASTNQTSLYLCASSVSTARHSQLQSAQKAQDQREVDTSSCSHVSPGEKTCPR
ncbi:hypothetical protein CB1_000804043 [Camelus ferus]|nr:hypothetical protein CB1_000804043 [Camelus ferus]